jgi:hypothetical protein
MCRKKKHTTQLGNRVAKRGIYRSGNKKVIGRLWEYVEWEVRSGDVKSEK